MPYINSDGTVTEKRSWIRLSLISDFIWGVVDAFGLFFSSLYNPSRPITAGRYVRNRNESSRTGGEKAVAVVM